MRRLSRVPFYRCTLLSVAVHRAIIYITWLDYTHFEVYIKNIGTFLPNPLCRKTHVKRGGKCSSEAPFVLRLFPFAVSTQRACMRIYLDYLRICVQEASCLLGYAGSSDGKSL